jgi:two-component system copper resistance phosphate regulon response regulator CusR
MRILVIEDEPRVASFIQKGLAEQAYNVDVALDGKDGEQMALKEKYDLVVLDVMLPKKSGIDICISLRKEHPSLPILMLTALDSTEDTVKGLNAGADDYLAKPFEFAELLARVRALLRRAQATRESNNLISCADLVMDTSAKTVRRQEKLIELTAREFSLLEYLLINKGRVVSRVDILERVWDTNFDTNTNVVDVYINFLRKKMDKPFDVKLINTVTGMGYVLKEPEE